MKYTITECWLFSFVLVDNLTETWYIYGMTFKLHCIHVMMGVENL